jgi:DNA-binding NtrC family response regulator
MQGPAPLLSIDDSAHPTVDIRQPLREARERWVLHFERQYIEALLRAHGGSVSEAAGAAGMNRTHFYRLLSRCGIRLKS